MSACGYKQKFNISPSYTRYTPDSRLGRGGSVCFFGFRLLDLQLRATQAGVPFARH